MENIIIRLRKNSKISQQALADRLQISRPTLDKIEKEEKSLTLDQIKICSQVFEISPEVFISGQLPAEKHTTEELITIPQKNLEKFKEVFLYILEKVGSRPNVGQTVLYKLLYFIDFDHFEKYQEQLIGATYIKNHHGPTPKEFIKIVEEMKKVGDLEEVKSEYFNFEMKKYLARRSANLSQLKASELQTIERVLEKYAGKSAKELSDLSHKDMPWAASEDGEEIDYQLAFYRTEPFSTGKYDEL